MVDALNSPKDAPEGNLKHFAGKTHGMLKSGFKTVMHSSNDFINGISSKLEAALSLSGDSDVEASTEEKAKQKEIVEDKSEDKFSRTAELFNKKLRSLQFRSPLSFEDYAAMTRHRKRKEAKERKEKEKEEKAETTSEVDSANVMNSEQSTHSLESSGSVSAKSSKSSKSVGLQATGPDPYDKLKYKTEPVSSESASEMDGYGPSTSLELSDQDGKKHWRKSGSEGSIQSWASSLSYDSQSDDVAELVEFMRTFIFDLFNNPSAITLERKAKFGELAQHEAGRLWFSRFLNSQRINNKKVDESTFYSLIQYFAIVLFECSEADDFSPAKSLMNMCFTFYHEVEVPGCEAYREYPSTYLKDQVIWHSLRFWNAAFFDALQCEWAHRSVVTRDDVEHYSMQDITDYNQYQENITFGQLATFTCNMHAFGLSKDLCLEFLRKQCIFANLKPEQEKILRDNIDRMYSETEAWR